MSPRSVCTWLHCCQWLPSLLCESTLCEWFALYLIIPGSFNLYCLFGGHYPLCIPKDFIVLGFFVFSFPFFGCPCAIEHSISTACFSRWISINWNVYFLFCLLLVFYSVSIKRVHVHRLQASMPRTQINTNPHAHTDVHL